MMTIYEDIEQGTDEWLALRCGLLTASEMKHIMSPKTGKPAANDKSRSHVFEIAAQRISEYVEPSYISDDMLRGREDEFRARDLYAETTGMDVRQVAFITNDKWGFTLGASPDGLVGDDGGIECKSRRQKYQVETLAKLEVPEEYILQIQTFLLVTERKWCDFVSYSGGLPMAIIRVTPDPKMQAAIIDAAAAFEKQVAETIAAYGQNARGFPRTERAVEQEIQL